MKMLKMTCVMILKMTGDMGMSPVMFRCFLSRSLDVVMENINMTGDMGMSPIIVQFLLWEHCGCSRNRIREQSVLPLGFYHEDMISTATAEVLWKRCGCSRSMIRD